MTLAASVRSALDFLLPSACLGCGGRIPLEASHELVCAGCLSRLRAPAWPRCPRCHLPQGTGRSSDPDCRECRAWDPALDWARSAVVLEAPADSLVHALKYGGWRDLAPLMGAWMARVELPRAVPAEDALVVPVATTPRRERSRGYNQARLLAAQVAERTRLTLVDGLRRRPGGTTQVALHPAQRRTNVRDAFSVGGTAKRRIEGAHVLLIDDVLTTGSTAGAAARVLAEARAASVTAVTFARAIPYRVR